jgi:integrase
MMAAPRGHIERLPSGSFRVDVYGGTDPLTGRRIRFRKTCKDEVTARIELGKFLEQAQAGRQAESTATVGQLLDRYLLVGDWDVATREGYEGYIRRTIRPALGHVQVRQVRGPMLDTLYAKLRKCGDLACTGRPFTEHRNVPRLAAGPVDGRPAWQQVADGLREAIQSGALPAGSPIPSVRELHALQGIPQAAVRTAVSLLAGEGLIVARQGREAVVAGDVADADVLGRQPWRPAQGHDCALSGCRPHECRPMKAGTIRQIHSILSAAFAAAQRWEWTDRNPATSAKVTVPAARKQPAIPPGDVAAVIAEAAAQEMPQVALYLWLAAITGARRGELCAVQVQDVDLEHGVLRVAFNYMVRGGQKVRKDTKTHQERDNALDEASSAFIRSHLDGITAVLAAAGLELAADAYLFSNDPVHAEPWNPDWISHTVSELASAAGVDLNVKKMRRYTASQLLAGGFDLQNTAARLGHAGGGATTLRHYADPVPEVDRRAAAYLAELTADKLPTGLDPQRSKQDDQPGRTAEDAEDDGKS